MKKLLILSLVLVMVFAFGTTAFANENISDEKEVKSIVRQYFYSTYESLGSLKENIEYPTDIFCDKSELYNTEKIILNTEISRRLLQKEDLTFSKYEINLKFNNVKIKDNIAIIELMENHEIQFNCFDIPSYLQNKPHIFILSKINDAWFITTHKSENPILEYLNEEIQNGLSLDESIKKYLDNERQYLEASYKQTGITDNDQIEQEESASACTTRSYSYHSYNRTNARSYARSYALSNNPSPWYTYSADCTNFVSIALYKGGIKKDSNGSNTWYWNSRTDKTASWTAARYLRPYLLNNDGSTSTYGVDAANSSLGQVRTGDVVSFKSGSSIGHSAIITDASYSSSQLTYYNHKICQHSYGSGMAKDYPLASMPYATKYYTKIFGCYY